MAEPLVLGSKVSPEGRVVIPVEIRRRLGVVPGDQVQFVMREDGLVELVTARMLAELVWANNRGGGALDSTEVVREERQHDQMIDVRAEAGIAADADQPSDEAAETARLLAALGLDA
jgi:AbrB family looped-hinge helix DNA binding protein